MIYNFGYLIDIFLVLSNLAFLVCAVTAWRRGWGLLAYIYFLIVPVSGSFHLCDSYMGTCIFTFRTHKALDYIIASSVIPIIALFLIYFRRDRGRGDAYVPFLKKWLVLTAIFLNAIMVVTIRSTLWAQFIVTGVSLLIVVGYWLVFSPSIANFRDLYDWSFIALGLTMLYSSIACFVGQNYYPRQRWILHSLWHLCGAMGNYFILLSRPSVDRQKNLESRIPLRVVWTSLPSLKKKIQNDHGK